jgi:MFS family permease
VGWRAALQPSPSCRPRVPASRPAAAARGGPSRPTAGDRPSHLTFWALAALRFCIGVGFTLVNTHVVALAIDAGVAPRRAAAASRRRAGQRGGRLGVGWLTDRVGPAPALSFAFGTALAGVGCLGLLAATGQPGWLVAFVACYGLAQGSGGIVSTAAATAAFPGPAIGAITGWIALASGPGEALGAWSGGALYDATRGYSAALALAVVALVGGATAIWTTDRKEGSHAHASAHPR